MTENVFEKMDARLQSEASERVADLRRSDLKRRLIASATERQLIEFISNQGFDAKTMRFDYGLRIERPTASMSLEVERGDEPAFRLDFSQAPQYTPCQSIWRQLSYDEELMQKEVIAFLRADL